MLLRMTQDHLPCKTLQDLTTNLPAPGSEREAEEAEKALALASVAEVVRLYGLRM